MRKDNYNNKSYFDERIYNSEHLNEDPKIREYWRKILGDDVVNAIKDAYGVSLEEILFSEYDLLNFPTSIILADA